MRKVWLVVGIVGLLWGFAWAESDVEPASTTIAEEGLAEYEVIYQEHTVVPGDTLWDLSGKYLGDPFRWPEIWQLNPEIEDPHWIYPAQVLRIRELKRTAVKPEVEAPAITPLPEAAEPSLTFVIPPELPVFETTFKYRVRTNMIDYVSPKKVRSKGEIVETWEGSELLARSDKFYFQYKDPLKEGDYLALFRLAGKVSDRYGGKGRLGYLVDFVGEMKVIAVEEVKGKIFYTGEVTSSESEAEATDWLTDTKLQTVEIVANPATVDKTGYIVEIGPASGHDLATGDVCFINLGMNDGIEVGNTFLIYRSSPMKPKRHPRYLIGQLIVIRVAETASTALVTYAEKHINVGDMVKTELP